MHFSNAMLALAAALLLAGCGQMGPLYLPEAAGAPAAPAPATTTPATATATAP
jgi:predicted small lipoprotein YifL